MAWTASSALEWWTLSSSEAYLLKMWLIHRSEGKILLIKNVLAGKNLGEFPTPGKDHIKSCVIIDLWQFPFVPLSMSHPVHCPAYERCKNRLRLLTKIWVWFFFLFAKFYCLFEFCCFFVFCIKIFWHRTLHQHNFPDILVTSCGDVWNAR